MRIVLKGLSYLGLLLTVLPAFLHFDGVVAFEQHKWITFFGTAMYLSTSPFWMNKKINKS